MLCGTEINKIELMLKRTQTLKQGRGCGQLMMCCCHGWRLESDKCYCLSRGWVAGGWAAERRICRHQLQSNKLSPAHSPTHS